MSGRAAAVEALAERGPSGGWSIRSPRVGVYREAPREGARRTAGDSVGRLSVLNREQEVVLPAGVEGIVAPGGRRGAARAVEYGEVLFEMAPLPGGQAAGHPAGLVVPASSVPAGAAGLPEGCFAATSPIDGVFYARPSPGAPPFVLPGAAVETGRTLGLVEAMKSFNAVVYGEPGLPARAEVVEARAADGAEVRQGAVLFVLRPLSG
ncbi:MAG TPA: hypothetical protein VJV23_13800 [Candidatus Polarisedimenticolia bacterium]|nr:hypothetical protein [Candidatus Polarisedimenticolia bacterium]